MSKNIRFVLCSGGLLLFCIISSSLLFKKAVSQEITPLFNREISFFEERYAGVFEWLPFRGIIGYIDDDENVLKTVEAARAFIFTQYILAPRVIVRDLNREIIIGNFKDQKMGLIIAEKNSLLCVKDFGNGLMILKKKTQP